MKLHEGRVSEGHGVVVEYQCDLVERHVKDR